MGETVLFDFDGDFDLKQVETHGQGVEAKLVDSDAVKSLRVELAAVPDAGISLLAPGGAWDLSDRVAVVLEVENVGDNPVALRGNLNEKAWIDGFAVLGPGESDALEIILKRAQRHPQMFGLPGGHVALWEEAEPAKISRITIAAVDATGPSAIEIEGVRAVGEYTATPEEGVARALTPFVDRYGQYKHEEWPGKTHSDEDLAAQRRGEDEELDAYGGPDDWNQYGGWAAGPRLEATGHFRTWKHDGTWWLVDPEGCLFWSHGIDCVRLETPTPTEGREDYFDDVDERFHKRGSYDVSAPNLLRKYGEDWENVTAERAHRRLHSWGMNTMANWSDESLYLLRRTPYVVAVHYHSRELGEFPYRDMDMFRQVLRERLAQEKGKTSDDPWCIGYFVGNELRWPEEGRAELADTYYRICSEEVKRLAPDKLYLGSRLHDHTHPFGGTEDVVRASAKYCDVVSVNRYRFSPSDLRMPEGVDKPLIIGEFHFGALDRGLLHTGLRSLANQGQRAATYRHYVREALRHPHIVGTHWFQYRDQAVSGRFDGENCQIGFLDICDTPYRETVAASRDVGREIYEIRSGR